MIQDHPRQSPSFSLEDAGQYSHPEGLQRRTLPLVYLITHVTCRKIWASNKHSSWEKNMLELRSRIHRR
jgi:hypothetical protein